MGEYWIHRLPDSPTGRLGVSRIKRFLSSAASPADERYAAFTLAHSAGERSRLLSPAFRAGAHEQSADQMIEAAFNSDDADGLLHRLLLCDMQLYLPGDLLTLTDRVSMLHSLEVRVPFLDHPLIELMAQIPARHKLTLWRKKALFRRAFRSLLPPGILNRKKLGFSVPLALWLRSELKPLLTDVLSDGGIKAVGYLEHREVQRLVSEHLSGSANHESKLWALLNLVLWEQQRKSSRACRPMKERAQPVATRQPRVVVAEDRRVLAASRPRPPSAGGRRTSRVFLVFQNSIRAIQHFQRALRTGTQLPGHVSRRPQDTHQFQGLCRTGVRRREGPRHPSRLCSRRFVHLCRRLGRQLLGVPGTSAQFARPQVRGDQRRGRRLRFRAGATTHQRRRAEVQPRSRDDLHRLERPDEDAPGQHVLRWTRQSRWGGY